MNKGILTGVLRIAKESIFTGMNNFDVFSIFSAQYSEYFGFTEKEVRELSEMHGTSQDTAVIREWYDGYNFGSSELYNPWSVLQYFDKGRTPEAYWIGTSGNDIIHTMFHNISAGTLQNLAALVQGGRITASVSSEYAYPDLYRDSSGNTLYAVLLMTGYLKTADRKARRSGETGNNLKYRCELMIPNKEIQKVFHHTYL